MPSNDIEDLSTGQIERRPAQGQGGEDATGRIAQSPIEVAVPSVVSAGKAKSAPVVEIKLDSAKAESGTYASSQEKDRDGNTSNLQSASAVPGNEEADHLYANPTLAESRNLLKEAQADVPEDGLTNSLSQDDAIHPQDVAEESFASISRGSFSGSLNLESVNQKSIDIRKEQIQRAKKRAVDQKRKRNIKLIRRVMITVVIVLTLAVVGAFSFFRWGMYEDYADMQGTWQIQGTDAKVKISGDKIRLSKGVSYTYEIDPVGKTLKFDFGQLSGNGRYRFSLDRNQLSIADGNYSTTDILSDDIPWTLQALMGFLASNDIATPDLGDGSITLSRVAEE